MCNLGLLLIQVKDKNSAIHALSGYPRAIVVYEDWEIDPIITGREGFPAQAKAMINASTWCQEIDQAMRDDSTPEKSQTLWVYQTHMTMSELIARLFMRGIVDVFSDQRLIAGRKASV